MSRKWVITIVPRYANDTVSVCDNIKYQSYLKIKNKKTKTLREQKNTKQNRTTIRFPTQPCTDINIFTNVMYVFRNLKKKKKSHCWEHFSCTRNYSYSAPCIKPLTSSLLMGTDGCRRLPISLRYSKRSASSLILSLSVFSTASSTSVRTFLIWFTVRAWHRKMQTRSRAVCMFWVCISLIKN